MRSLVSPVRLPGPQGRQDTEALGEPRAECGEWVGNQDTQLPLFPRLQSVQVPPAPGSGEQAAEVSHPLHSPELTYSLPIAGR